MNNVISAWGNPSSKSSLSGDYEYWHYDFVGAPYIRFKEQVISDVWFFLNNCPLQKIVTRLGPPEKVEITILVSDIDLSASYTQEFHFPSLGFAYYRPCDGTQDCFTFQASDTVIGKEFYSPNKIISDSTGFNMASYVYNWHGFNIDVEKMENKIKDYVIITRTP